MLVSTQAGYDSESVSAVKKCYWCIPRRDLTLSPASQEERLLRLGEELRRLAIFEAESHRKDGVISGLRDQVVALRHQLTQNQPTSTTAAVDPEVNRRLRCLERNITDKRQQIQQLKEQVGVGVWVLLLSKIHPL